MPLTAGLRHDLRQCLRRLIRQPALAIAALLSLALGISSVVAIFALWYAALFAPLPGVAAPDQLVMLTDPRAAGLLRGRQGGARRWLSFTEFVNLRDANTVFSGLMASQGRLTTWPVRLPDGAVDEIKGRLVSIEYFDVLGVPPAVGRLFAPSDDLGAAAVAVISYQYWGAASAQIRAPSAR